MQLILCGGGSGDQNTLANQKLNEIIDHTRPILYIPLAMNEEEHSYDSCYEWIQGELANVDIPYIEMVRTFEELASKDLQHYAALYIGGGNTYKLLLGLKQSGAFNNIRNYINNIINNINFKINKKVSLSSLFFLLALFKKIYISIKELYSYSTSYFFVYLLFNPLIIASSTLSTLSKLNNILLASIFKSIPVFTPNTKSSIYLNNVSFLNFCSNTTKAGLQLFYTTSKNVCAPYTPCFQQ